MTRDDFNRLTPEIEKFSHSWPVQVATVWDEKVRENLSQRIGPLEAPVRGPHGNGSRHPKAVGHTLIF
jgi:hypothetical protein